MPANPLLTAASTLAPVQPTTGFFDPSMSLDIMQRYALTGSERAFAEDALKSSDMIDRLANYEPQQRQFELERQDKQRELWDRDDEEYVKKKEFESVRGEFLESLASIPFDDPEFDNKIAGLMADPEAANDDAVKALLNFKVGRREQMESAALRERQYQERKGAELMEMLGGSGMSNEEIRSFVKEDGTFDDQAAIFHMARRAYGTKQRELQQQSAEERYGKYDPTVLDARNREDLDEVVKDRRAAINNITSSYNFGLSPDADKIIENATNYDSATFEAAILEDLTNAADANGQPAYDNTKAGDKKAVRDAARSLWAAAHRRLTLPPKQAAEPAGGSVRPEKDRAANAQRWLQENVR